MLAAGVLGRMTDKRRSYGDGNDGKIIDLTSLAQQVEISLVCFLSPFLAFFLQLTCFFPRDGPHAVQSATMKNEVFGYTCRWVGC